MHEEGKSTHINTSSWKCWLKKHKLWRNKSQILLSTCIFSQKNVNMICSNTRYPGWHSPVWRGSKQALQPQKSLEEGWKSRRAAQQWTAPLRPQILSEYKLASLSSYTKKNSRMNQILLQRKPITNLCSFVYAPLHMASVRAGWECRGRNRCLWGPAKLSFLLAKRNCISIGCVLEGATRDMRCERKSYEHTPSPCPRGSKGNPSPPCKSIVRPLHQNQGGIQIFGQRGTQNPFTET